MLQKIRDNAHGWWAYVAVPVLILVFALFGINNYLTGSLGQSDMAKVNGETIEYNEFAILYQQINHQQNPSQNKTTANYIKVQVLQNLVNQELFYLALQDIGFAVSPAVIDQVIYQTPAFQSQGKFSMEQYQNTLQNLGMTTEDLRNSLAKTYLIQQFQNGLIGSEFAMPQESSYETMLANLVRDVTYVTIDPASFAKNVQVSDADVAQYYQTHQSQFMTPYQVQLQYLTLSLDQFSKQIKDPNQAQAAFQNAVTSLSNVTFQNPTTLAPAATMLNMPVQTTGWLSSNSNTGLFANPQVLAAAMSDGVLNGGNNSSVINVGKNQVMVLRVMNKQAPTPLTFNQVSAQIKSMLIMQQEVARAEAVAKEVQVGLNSGTAFNWLAANNGLNLQTATGISIASKNINQDLLAAFTQTGVQGVGMVPSNNKIVVFQVTKVYAPSKLNVKIPPQAIQGLWSQIEVGSFLAHQQLTAKVQINDALLKAQ